MEEKPEIMYRYDIDLTKTEQEHLLKYAFQNIPQEQLDALLIEWASIELLKAEMKKIS